MEISQLVIVAVLLVLLAEVTYVAMHLPKQITTKKQKRLILIDTSVLIDGRIVAVAKSGFVTDTLAIPRSVVGELQYLADNADHEKRARARHGLDIIAELQQISHITVQVLQDSTTVKEGVDERLLNLAKKYNASICTIDYNLNKVAIVEGIRVLNVNELAQSLRMAYLPGERTLLELTQKGQDSHQAVGHLSDGTMVVVENASQKIGSSIEVEFIRSLQTAAGKMMFAKPVEQVKLQRPADNSPKKLAKSTGTKPAPQPERRTQSVEPRKRDDTRGSNQQGPRKPNNRGTAKRPNNRSPRSSDRESAFIDLVEKQ
ncbi:MAG TPA: hypothetical protein VFH06_05700 [Candidatus Saccharimonadales bacterium]|nr:hypothetical protein [Candidatus Saccharimonadales bacterium]